MKKKVGHTRYHFKHLGDIAALGPGRTLTVLLKFITTMGLFLSFYGDEKRVDRVYESMYLRLFP
ncbi:MAG: hypothetical protein ACLFS6_07340 [Methanomassiliicoccales archaeon]